MILKILLINNKKDSIKIEMTNLQNGKKTERNVDDIEEEENRKNC